ncbi:hypothetical protein [Nocardia miyunensis]|uniref:hypothetical protein n=1 Tax=Nocardia miyunensis TaxID=282684 RepID=UPI00082CEF4F|nr:hypothetical protein [Nocardia miyunensis]
MGLLGAVTVLAGCSSGDTSTLDAMAKCGKIHFASPPHVVADKSGALFGSGQTLWAVVDIPLDQLDAFRQQSGLGQFNAGVPLDIPGYFKDAGAVADVLKTDDGNVSVEDAHAIPARRVAVHTTGPAERRVFISVLC